MKTLVRGVGINDSETPVFLRLGDGKVWQDPIYRTWANILTRCTTTDKSYGYDYAPNHNHTYLKTKICDEWLTYSKFRDWCIEKNWEGNHLDKDLLGDGTLYSPHTCVFLPSVVNSLMTGTRMKRKGGLLGTGYQDGRYCAAVQCEGKKFKPLKYFDTEMEAHNYFREGKIEVIKYLAEKYLYDGYICITAYFGLKGKISRIQSEIEANIPTIRI